MAAANKYEIFTEHLASKVHDLFGTGGSTADVLKYALSRDTDAPVLATDAVLADRTQPTGTGYTAGGIVADFVGSRSNGTLNLVTADKFWQATAGDWQSAQYVELYNDTPASPLKPLILNWSFGSPFTLANNETFTVDAGAVTGSLA
jgi:hypothetical protein